MGKASINIDIDVSLLSRKIQKIVSTLNDPDLRMAINYYIGKRLNQYVPYDPTRSDGSGRSLRESMYADASGITWATPYAHYQWAGVVYAPNYVGFDEGGNVIWRSRGEKHPTARELGTPGSAVLKPQFGQGNVPDVEEIYWEFGYSTPGTQHHWSDLYTTVGGDRKSRSFRREVNLHISNMVRQALKGI